MSTRSDIIIEQSDGKWARIYCHWDGNPQHNGAMLVEHYNSQSLAEALVAPGDLSSLQEQCTKPEGHSFDHPIKGYCVYYGRDRGDSFMDAEIGDSLELIWPDGNAWTEYTYVWKRDDGWFVGDPEEGSESLQPVKDVLANNSSKL